MGGGTEKEEGVVGNGYGWKSYDEQVDEDIVMRCFLSVSKKFPENDRLLQADYKGCEGDEKYSGVESWNTKN